MNLLKSASKIGGLTLISRMLGLIRDQMVAFTLGTGSIADSFFVAQRLPNLFRALFAEGAFNSAFIPLLAKQRASDKPEAAQQFSNEVFAVLFSWLLLFCSLAIAVMPLAIYIIAPGLSENSAQRSLTVELTRICFPYLLFISLTALLSGILNTFNRFTASSAAPIVLNIIMIASNLLVWWLGTGNSPLTGKIFAYGVLVAGIAQFLLTMIACKRAGMSLAFVRPRLTPDVRQVIRLSIPGIISGGIMQINLVIATMLASLDHAVSDIYYAERLYQFPLGVIGVAIGVVLLPDLSRRLRAGDEIGAQMSQNRSLEFSLFLTFPAAIALMAIPYPIILTVFEHGAFDRISSNKVAPALIAFASALPAFAITKVLQPSFYAREDTKTPMRFALYSVMVNLLASLSLFYLFGAVGIAIGTSLAAWANSFLLGLGARRAHYYQPDQRLKKRVWRILLAGFLMGIMLLILFWNLQEFYRENTPFFPKILILGFLLISGAVSYFTLSHFLGALTFQELRKLYFYKSEK